MTDKSTLKDNLKSLQALAKERTVKTQNIEYDLETLVKKINNKIIKLNPDYQRNHRWDNETSSKLIESLILNIPIPTIYLSQDVDVDEEVGNDVARYSVIDGQQRLTAIYGFMSNQYPLVGLKVLEPLNDSYYQDLPPFLARRLEERTIKCLRIDSTIDSQVKYDIFERLNTGSVQLTSQELRNAVYRGPFNDLIKTLAKEKYFLQLMNIDIDKIEENPRVRKMDPEECVLRFYSLYNNGIDKFKKSFKDFLSEQMNSFNKLSDSDLEIMKNHFKKVMTVIIENFGENPFAKYKVEEDKNITYTSKFNFSVFDALAIGISNNILNDNLLITEEKIKSYYNLFYNDDFVQSISGSTNDRSKVIYRINIVTRVFSK